MLLVDERCLQPDLVGLIGLFRSRASLQAEILTLRHQLASATAVTCVGRRANNAVSQGRCPTSALVRENPLLRRHEVITGRHTMYCPPFTVRVDPVMKPASSVARKTTLRAISSGSPRRLTGINGRMLFSSTSFGTACTISVLM